MEEELVLPETAKLAKEKGFDIPCRDAYDIENQEINSAVFYNGNFEFELEDILNAEENSGREHCLAPTQSLLQRWLREFHKINVESNYLPNIEKYGALYIPMTLKKPKDYETYGQAYASTDANRHPVFPC